MKYSFNILLAAVLTGCLVSCADYLEHEPKNLQTTSTAFRSYSNFKTYSWGLYGDAFSPDFNGALTAYTKDTNTPWMVNNNANNNNSFAYQNVTENTNNNYWSFSFLRRVNTMLDNIDASNMSDKEKDHWRSVGYFFRAYHYYSLISKYGDVPWVDHVVAENEEDVIYGPRVDRKIVAKNVLDELEFAVEHVNVNGDGPNTINRNVVLALLSRFSLFEGTWRKHHGIEDPETYLNACVKYSGMLIEAAPDLAASYDLLFTSESLAGMKGVLLYYEFDDKTFSHQGGRQAGASGNAYEGTKDLVDLYLAQNGYPVSNPLSGHTEEGDHDPYVQFRGRDLRLPLSIIPPYRLKVNGNNDQNYQRYKVGETFKLGLDDHVVTFEDSCKYVENIELVNALYDKKLANKKLPTQAWNNSTLNGYAPRFRAYSANGGNPCTGYHGYWFYKYYNTADCVAKHGQNTTDIAIFRIEEAMLNYAEAKCELGSFTQADADKTVNRIRQRVNVAPMQVALIDESFDPARDKSVSPLLWEIRRERIVELWAENKLFDDMRRWRVGHYLDHQLLGIWVKNREYNNALVINGYADKAASADKEGYVRHRLPPKGFLDHYYLYPIPLKEMVLNPQLTQNPGFKGPSPADAE